MAIPVTVVLVALVALRIAYADRALPGTTLAGEDVGGEDRDELRARVERLADRTIVVAAGDRRIRLRTPESGLAIDVEGTVDRVLDTGRDGLLGGLFTTPAGIVSSREAEVDARIDDVALGRAVGTVARSVGRRAFPGAIEVDPEFLEVRAVAPRSGRSLDTDDLRARLRRAMTSGTAAIDARVRVTRVATREEVEAVAQEAQDFLDAPVRFTGLGKPLELPAARIAPVLRLSTAGEGRVALGTSAKELDAFVAGLAERRDRAARDAVLSAPGRSVLLEDKGDVSWRPRRADVRVVREARSGRGVDRPAAAKAIDAAVRAGEHEIELPVTRTEPKVTARDARKLTRLIGTFTTRYVAGQPRVTNIRRIARTVDGTLVAPGAQFSLNGRVGPRTKAGGYVEAPFIADGKLEPSVGGGVSQFSTTLYNAAYFAGLKIDTHTPHSIFIDRYPAGREATLNFPSIDLRWTNDTDAPVLVRTFTDENSVTVSLYGDNGGRRVRAETGERRPFPGGDFVITVTRHIRFADGREAQDSFTSRYEKLDEDE